MRLSARRCSRRGGSSRSVGGPVVEGVGEERAGRRRARVQAVPALAGQATLLARPSSGSSARASRPLVSSWRTWRLTVEASSPSSSARLRAARARAGRAPEQRERRSRPGRRAGAAAAGDPGHHRAHQRVLGRSLRRRDRLGAALQRSSLHGASMFLIAGHASSLAGDLAHDGRVRTSGPGPAGRRIGGRTPGRRHGRRSSHAGRHRGRPRGAGGVSVYTPMEESRWLSGIAGGPVLLKAENLQRTGSFKIRGAYLRMSRLSERGAGRRRGRRQRGQPRAGRRPGRPAARDQGDRLHARGRADPEGEGHPGVRRRRARSTAPPSTRRWSRRSSSPRRPARC